MKNISLTSVELRITQKIQSHFPKGMIPKKALAYWDSCDVVILESVIFEALKRISIAEKFDTIIRVNRNVAPIYPVVIMHHSRMGKLRIKLKGAKRKDLELTGPAKYDITEVGQYRLPEQKKYEFVTGNDIYQYLSDNGMLEKHLGLADLLAIQAKGIIFFRKYFAGKSVFGWKSMSLTDDNRINDIWYGFVPYLIEEDGKVILGWLSLGPDDTFYSNNPALYFKN